MQQGENKKLGPDLWLAARNGELDKVKALIERGAPVNFKVSFVAAEGAKQEKKKKIDPFAARVSQAQASRVSSECGSLSQSL